jgi:hypothetical protein
LPPQAKFQFVKTGKLVVCAAKQHLLAADKFHEALPQHASFPFQGLE